MPDSDPVHVQRKVEEPYERSAYNIGCDKIGSLAWVYSDALSKARVMCKAYMILVYT